LQPVPPLSPPKPEPEPEPEPESSVGVSKVPPTTVVVDLAAGPKLRQHRTRTAVKSAPKLVVAPEPEPEPEPELAATGAPVLRRHQHRTTVKSPGQAHQRNSRAEPHAEPHHQPGPQHHNTVAAEASETHRQARLQQLPTALESAQEPSSLAELRSPAESWHRVEARSGKVYYLNPLTNHAQWELPTHSAAAHAARYGNWRATSDDDDDDDDDAPVDMNHRRQHICG
jgi:hypothetical protein